MSADNRICVMQNRLGEWGVWHGSASIEYHEPPVGAKAFLTEGEADKAADLMEREIGYVEYGVQHIGVNEQEAALTGDIECLRERLHLLRTTGCQFMPESSTRHD